MKQSIIKYNIKLMHGGIINLIDKITDATYNTKAVKKCTGV